MHAHFLQHAHLDMHAVESWADWFLVYLVIHGARYHVETWCAIAPCAYYWLGSSRGPTGALNRPKRTTTTTRMSHPRCCPLLTQSRPHVRWFTSSKKPHQVQSGFAPCVHTRCGMGSIPSCTHTGCTWQYTHLARAVVACPRQCTHLAHVLGSFMRCMTSWFGGMQME
jgi:hypothetical protein